VEDHHVDRPEVDARQRVKPTGTNRSSGLILALRHAQRQDRCHGQKHPKIPSRNLDMIRKGRGSRKETAAFLRSALHLTGTGRAEIGFCYCRRDPHRETAVVDDQEERIRRRAHEIWEGEGRPDGKDAEHWAQAAQELGVETPPEPTREVNLSAVAEGMGEASGTPVSPDGGSRGRVAKARRKDATPQT
jgi:hypothetical protein